MNKTEQVQQLRLAAELIETGHPFEVRHETSEKWLPSRGVNPVKAVLQNWYLRRVKPSSTPFQLPPPPPGMRWHREDGWREGDLPQGYRPCVLGEDEETGYEEFHRSSWKKGHFYSQLGAELNRVRTTRPLVFQHEGKEWTWHKPGDPMPCDGERRIFIISIEGKTVACDGIPLAARSALSNQWDQTLGWRYAETSKRVELGPEDVPPGSILKANSWASHEWRSVGHVYSDGVLLSNCPATAQWSHLMLEYQINRSIPLTGKWDANAWEPCHKTLANG